VKPNAAITIARAATVLLLLAVDPRAARGSEAPALRVLFVGNSLTYVNDLPAVLAQLADAQPAPLRIETRTFVAAGGTLAERWADGAARAALDDGHWDALVLQERGGVAACLVDSETRNGGDCRAMVAAHRAFADAAAARADHVLLLETWSASEAGQSAIDTGMRELARRTGTRIVHSGDALTVMARRDGRAATFPDGMHPSPRATLLMAAQLLRALTGQPPARAPASVHMSTVETPRPAQPLESQRGAEREPLRLDERARSALLSFARRYR
jgi:hypothetical protein